MKTYKEFKEFVEENPDLVSGLIECDGSMQEAYRNYIKQQEITKLKKENEDLSMRLRGAADEVERLSKRAGALSKRVRTILVIAMQKNDKITELVKENKELAALERYRDGCVRILQNEYDEKCREVKRLEIRLAELETSGVKIKSHI